MYRKCDAICRIQKHHDCNIMVIPISFSFFVWLSWTEGTAIKKDCHFYTFFRFHNVINGTGRENKYPNLRWDVLIQLNKSFLSTNFINHTIILNNRSYQKFCFGNFLPHSLFFLHRYVICTNIHPSSHSFLFHIIYNPYKTHLMYQNHPNYDFTIIINCCLKIAFDCCGIYIMQCVYVSISHASSQISFYD